MAFPLGQLADMALYSRTKPKYIFHPKTCCMYPTAATLLSQVHEFTEARANYHETCPTEAEGSKQEVQAEEGHEQRRFIY